MSKYALFSVYDKRTIGPLASAVVDAGYVIAATPGTGNELQLAGIPFVPISEITRNPDALKDCLQSFSFYTAGGIVYSRSNERHLRDTEAEQIPSIDIVVCNLTNVEDTVKTEFDFTIQHVDLGGVSLLQAAAINYRDVLVISSPNDYDAAINHIKADTLDRDFRKEMAVKTFSRIATYEQTLASVLLRSNGL